MVNTYKHILIIFASVLIVGCAGSPSKPTIETQIVEVPVSSCPVPREISRPPLAIDNISKEDASDPGKVVQAYKAAVKALQGYARELELELNGYKKK